MIISGGKHLPQKSKMSSFPTKPSTRPQLSTFLTNAGVSKSTQSLSDTLTLQFKRWTCLLTLEGLAGYKVPKSVEFVEELPVNATGKISKEKILREPYWEGHERQVH